MLSDRTKLRGNQAGVESLKARSSFPIRTNQQRLLLEHKGPRSELRLRFRPTTRPIAVSSQMTPSQKQQSLPSFQVLIFLGIDSGISIAKVTRVFKRNRLSELQQNRALVRRHLSIRLEEAIMEALNACKT
ncbi:hypothetical protein TIFTF001_022344 [Ficus carica]|uniref:Uncharacterized protein n=1 Tax=Ficus carica TaxID=3494 RepID=A0AA88DEF7_FICCA|nr:hypothetical protein TIFTF001_022344 [Ficus carica]